MRFDDWQKTLGVVADLLIQPDAELMRSTGFLPEDGGNVEAERSPAPKVAAQTLVIAPNLSLSGCGLELQENSLARR